MKKLVAIALAFLLCLTTIGALAELSDFEIATTAEENKVILVDCQPQIGQKL